MKHPPYHLRPNKAIDRYMLVEVVQRLPRLKPLAQYYYVGLGGPFLEDFRLLASLFPTLRQISIEEDDETHKRQQFHLPSKNVRLVKDTFQGFMTKHMKDGARLVAWLDYTDLKLQWFYDFMNVLSRVGDYSVIKITLCVNPPPADALQREFDEFLPGKVSESDRRKFPFAQLLQKMIRIAAEKAIPAVTERTFQILCSSIYSDGTPMFTLTGMVCRNADVDRVRDCYGDWSLGNLEWADPEVIDVPVLSTKERLHLEKLLPCNQNDVERLVTTLGYNIENTREETVSKLLQYVAFHSCYPYFGKIVV